jgi:dihydrodipicolinate synthase/N-acetylneuraminate lyase
MPKTNLISAIGTPLNPDESLHLEGLERLLNLQLNAGIDGVLIAGTMGLLQLLRDQTYAQLVEHGVRLWKGKGEILVGVGDAGFARTADRIGYVNGLAVDGVVALSPYFVRFRQEELLDYFRGLADISKAPLFLYDLPSFTGVKLEVPTVFELSKHPNIAGIKFSGSLNDALDLIGSVHPNFRVIVAQADQVDAICEQGITNQLDGVFSLIPEWTKEIANAAESGDWVAAADAQRRLSGVLSLLREYGVFPAYHELLHVREIPGLFAPKPFQLLSDAQRNALASHPLVGSLRLASRHIGDGGAQRVAGGREFVNSDGATTRTKAKSQAG